MDPSDSPADCATAFVVRPPTPRSASTASAAAIRRSRVAVVVRAMAPPILSERPPIVKSDRHATFARAPAGWRALAFSGGPLLVLDPDAVDEVGVGVGLVDVLHGGPEDVELREAVPGPERKVV